MKIRALIIDDEPLAQNVIQQYALKLPNLEIVATFDDALSAHNSLQDESIDLIFLDINMPKLSGISFLKTLKNPPLVIFTTAYSEYALEAYELNATDYLKKPFSFERFCKAFYRAEELLLLKERGINEKEEPKTKHDFLFIKANKKSYKVKFNQILFIEGLGDYIKIHLRDDKLVTNLSMKKILSLLPIEHFYRVHKSYIISLDEVESVEGNMVSVGGQKIPIGNSYRHDFMEFINQFMAD